MPAPSTPEVKAKALEIYKKDGPTAAAHAVGVAKSTVCKWAKAAGVQTEVPQLMKATQASVARRNLKAAEWREEMTDFLRDVTLRAVEVEWLLLSKAKDLPSLEKVSATRAKAVSDLLLITGEATQRIGMQGDMQDTAASVAKLRDDLAERRKQAEAAAKLKLVESKEA